MSTAKAGPKAPIENRLVVLNVCANCSVFNEYGVDECENCQGKMSEPEGRVQVITTIGRARRLMPGFEDKDFEGPNLGLLREQIAATETMSQQQDKES